MLCLPTSHQFQFNTAILMSAVIRCILLVKVTAVHGSIIGMLVWQKITYNERSWFKIL